jgi:hypothetical protein
MPTYTQVSSIVTAAEKSALIQMLIEASPEVPVEGFTDQFWSVPIYAEGTNLNIFPTPQNPNPTMPTPIAWGCFGPMDDKLLALLPVGVILQPEDVKDKP